MTVIITIGQLVWISAADVIDTLTHSDCSSTGALYGRAIHGIRELHQCRYVAFKVVEWVQTIKVFYRIFGFYVLLLAAYSA